MHQLKIAAGITVIRWSTVVWALVVGFCVGIEAAPSDGRLFDHLRALSVGRHAVGDPSRNPFQTGFQGVEGPKDVAVADVDGDGKADFAASNKDGTVTLYFGQGDGGFGNPVHLQTWLDAPLDLHGLTHTNYLTNSCVNVSTNRWYENGELRTNWTTICVPVPETVIPQVISLSGGPIGLRGLAIGSFGGNGRRDIAVASPGEGLIYLFENQGGRDFSMAKRIEAWIGVRDLAAGDFDGDGRMDLVAAGTTNGLVQFRSMGGGQFVKRTNINWLGISQLTADFPQPAFYLKTFRMAGRSRHVVVMGRAQGGEVTLVDADGSGRMKVGSVLTNVTAHALDVGPLLGPVSGGVPDLVSVDHDDELLEIRPGLAGEGRFGTNVVQKLSIPGRAHGVAIVDVDGDGWNDLVVVLQAFAKVRVFKNNHGTFEARGEVAVGAGPRELAVGDFNGDGLGDVVVLNRRSMDASILLSDPKAFGFKSIEMVYPTDGEVVSLQVYDFNGDGLDDVVQIHRGAGEMSVRLARPGGELSEPVFLTMGTAPSDARSVDLNGDGRLDVLAVDLRGFVVARLGNGDGSFGPELRTELNDTDNGGRSGALFSLTTGDFDGDKIPDIAAGFMDCRVGFFRGLGDGTFQHTHTHPLGYETHGLGVGDFDGDGDLDLVASPWDGSLIVVRNPGNLLQASVLDRSFVTNRISNVGAWTVVVTDQNHDGDLDVLVDGGSGYTLYLGAAGVGFVAQTNLVGSTKEMAASSLVTADFDRDGIDDILSGCLAGGCVNVSLGIADGGYATPIAIPVPSGRLLATGDIDGDGFPDLIGGGEVLWTALSGREPRIGAARKMVVERMAADGLFINEVLASNDSVPLASDGGRFSDFIEIYNGGELPRSLQGWKLTIARTNSLGVGQTNEYKFPDQALIDARGHLVLICSERIRTAFHTGFVLPAEGALLSLVKPGGLVADQLSYPGQVPNRSYARFQDGVNGFVATQAPTPGASNTDNGLVGPRVSFEGVDLARMAPGVPIRFFARAKDDVGIVNLSLLWRRLDYPDTETRRLVLYDDGLHGDGGSQDGLFSGEIPEGLELGAEVQFYLECTDLSGEVDTAPSSPRFVKPGEHPLVYTMAVGGARPDLELSEVVARNLDSLRDEHGNSPDWVEIRNPTDKVVSLAGISLAREFGGAGGEFVFTNTVLLKPGEHWVIYMDGKPELGEFHAPFKLDADGGKLVLMGRSKNGARLLLDSVRYDAQSADVGFMRLGRGGPWVTGKPTPRTANIRDALRGVWSGMEFVLAYPTEIGRTYTVEFTDDLVRSAWSVMRRVSGVGFEQTIASNVGPRRFFRVREE